MPEFNSITEPIPSLTTSSSSISVSPKRIDTGSWTSIRTARFDALPASTLSGDMSMRFGLPVSLDVARDCEGFARRIHRGLRIQLALSSNFDDYWRFLPLLDDNCVSDLKRQQRLHRKQS